MFLFTLEIKRNKTEIKQSTHGKECCTICEQQTEDFLFHFPLRKNSPSQLQIGQFPQDEENGKNVAFLSFFGALL